MVNIISFSLYGADPLYCEGAVINAILANEVYPSWRCRFYVDDQVPENYRKELENLQCEVIQVSKRLGPLYGRYWRFWVAADPNVDRFIVRDVDSRLNTREKAAVDEWINSEKSYHIMRDSFHHKKRVLGGMWGAVGGVLPNIADLIDEWGQYDQAGQCDQFMSEVVYRLMKADYLCHDSMGHYEDATPFPPHARMNGTSYVGEIIHPDRPELDVWRRLGELSDHYLLALEKLHECDEYARSLLLERDALLASFSWRVTSPLRSVAARVRALRVRVSSPAGFGRRAGPSVT